jgi:hypothetical protein
VNKGAGLGPKARVNKESEGGERSETHSLMVLRCKRTNGE